MLQRERYFCILLSQVDYIEQREFAHHCSQVLQIAQVVRLEKGFNRMHGLPVLLSSCF